MQGSAGQEGHNITNVYDPNAIYYPSEEELTASLSLEEGLDAQKLLTPESLQKTTSDFTELNKYVFLSPAEMDEEALAWKNGTPLPLRTLSANEQETRYQDKKNLMNDFYSKALEEVPKLSSMQLSHLRGNAFLGVFAYSYLKDYFVSLPEREKQIIETNLHWLVSLRKAAIDEAVRRGK
ncbi:hypothetical protein JWG41_07955 [Leptospira sp. 201903075]|uniref:hypothetical protein n=1 Tax=Leptospira chreensis TaxID=2810035 RepID=UPI00196371C9|nr:hypothetical protein [Leptospira chreensis]MBM9590374.1 hypothetical protein [Leptospira chreensis]